MKHPYQQMLLFSESELETNPVIEKTTLQDVIRELSSVRIEVDIALDQVFDDDYEKAKETLDNLAERIEQFLIDIK